MIHVGAAVIQQNGCFLVTQRPDSASWAGYWEFPGGKCEVGESLPMCLKRELKEELNLEVECEETAMTTIEVQHGEKNLCLHFHRCQCLNDAKPTAMENQRMRWVPAEELHTLRFIPADAEFINLYLNSVKE